MERFEPDPVICGEFDVTPLARGTRSLRVVLVTPHQRTSDELAWGASRVLDPKMNGARSWRWLFHRRARPFWLSGLYAIMVDKSVPGFGSHVSGGPSTRDISYAHVPATVIERGFRSDSTRERIYNYWIDRRWMNGVPAS